MTLRPPTRKRTTIHDVARLAGMSTATVSRFINGTAVVSEDGAARIQSAIVQLNYVPHQAAKVLASNRTCTLGLLLPQVSGNFFAPMLRGVERGALEAGYALLVHSTQLERRPHTGGARLFKRVLAEHNTDGLLVFTDSLDEPELRRLETAGFPTVLLHRSPPGGLNLPAVNIDNDCGVAALMAHLIETHHYRRIVHLRGETGHEDAIQRELGYRRALEANGIPYDPALVESGEFNTELARLAVRRLLEGGVHFEAIFAADDESASGAMMELRQAGLRVPEDIAVVGFDDLSLAEHLSPALTTVHSPIEEAAYTAARLLLDAIAGKPLQQPAPLPTNLVIRHSCGCP